MIKRVFTVALLTTSNLGFATGTYTLIAEHPHIGETKIKYVSGQIMDFTGKALVNGKFVQKIQVPQEHLPLMDVSPQGEWKADAWGMVLYRMGQAPKVYPEWREESFPDELAKKIVGSLGDLNDTTGVNRNIPRRQAYTVYTDQLQVTDYQKRTDTFIPLPEPQASPGSTVLPMFSGDALFFNNTDYSFHLLNTDTLKLTRLFKSPRPLQELAISPVGPLVAGNPEENAHGQNQKPVLVDGKLRFDPYGQDLLAWNINTGKLLANLRMPIGKIRFMDFTADGKYLMLHHYDRVLLYSTKNWKLAYDIEEKGLVFGIAYDPRNRWLYVSTYKLKVYLLKP